MNPAYKTLEIHLTNCERDFEIKIVQQIVISCCIILYSILCMEEGDFDAYICEL